MSLIDVLIRVSPPTANYSMVTDISVTNRYEIADHTMTHVGEPPDNEVSRRICWRTQKPVSLIFLGDIYRSAAISSPSMLSAVSPSAGFKASERPF